MIKYWQNSDGKIRYPELGSQESADFFDQHTKEVVERFGPIESIKDVDPDTIKDAPVPYDSDKFRFYCDLLSDNQRVLPVVVRSREDGDYELVEGIHRLAAHRALQKPIPVTVLSGALNKAISDIKEGHPILGAEKHPLGYSQHDYSHVLPPEIKSQGYGLHVYQGHEKDADGGEFVSAILTHPSGKDSSFFPGKVGYANGVVKPDGSLSVGVVAMEGDQHRGGKGLPMYEALLAHANKKMGASSVSGTWHSTAAHKIHQKLASKHGMKYSAGLVPGKETAPSADMDNKYGDYSYAIKMEEMEKAILPWLVAGAIMSGGATQQPKSTQALHQEISKQFSSWTPEGLHSDLHPIAHLESSWGKNMAHGKGKSEMDTAHGAVGFKPQTALEEYSRSKKMQQAHPGLDNPEAFLSKFKNDNKFYNEMASLHFERLKKIHGSKEKAAFAWRWGTGAASKATPEQIDAEPYVQKYKALASNTQGMQKAEDLSKAGPDFFNKIGAEIKARKERVGLLASSTKGSVWNNKYGGFLVVGKDPHNLAQWRVTPVSNEGVPNSHSVTKTHEEALHLAHSLGANLLSEPVKTMPLFQKNEEEFDFVELIKLEKGINGDWKNSAIPYVFNIDSKKNPDYHILSVLQDGKVAGRLSYRQASNQQDLHPVRESFLEDTHQGKGLYQEMLRRANEHVKSLSPYSKGIVSEGYQRSKAATRAWEKVGVPFGDKPVHLAPDFVVREDATKKAEDYVGSHKAPTNDGFNAPAHALSSLYPADIYTHPQAHHFYGHGGDHAKIDKETINMLRGIKNAPDMQVKIYRAIPKSVQGAKINPGDWVTPNKNYAKIHGEGPLHGDYQIIEHTVPAKHLFTDANSIHEFGYDPSEPAHKSEDLEKNKGTPTFPRLGVTDDRRETDIITSRRQLEMKLRSQQNNARALKYPDRKPTPAQADSIYEQAKKVNAAAQGTSGFGQSYARSGKVMPRGKNVLPQDERSVQLHEDLHNMMWRVGQKGNPIDKTNRDNLSRNLANYAYRSMRPEAAQLAHQYLKAVGGKDHYEEHLAHAISYLNDKKARDYAESRVGPAKQLQFHQALRDFYGQFKHAAQHADESWLTTSPSAIPDRGTTKKSEELDDTFNKSDVQEVSFDQAMAQHKEQWGQGKHKGAEAHYSPPVSNPGDEQGYVLAHIPVQHLNAIATDDGRVDQYKDVLSQQDSMGPSWGKFSGRRPTVYLFDGNHRALAAQGLGRTHVPVMLPKQDYERYVNYHSVQKSEELEKKTLDQNTGYTFTHEIEEVPESVHRLTKQPVPAHKYVKVLAHHNGDVVGSLHLGRIHANDETANPFQTEVHPEHRRKGVASAMYAHAEKITGLKMAPSSTQSAEGRMLWEGNENNKQFGKADDLMPGGKGDDKPDEDFDPQQLKYGMAMEMEEHGLDEARAKEIAKDHLSEDPDYYLNKFEEEFVVFEKAHGPLTFPKLGLGDNRRETPLVSDPQEFSNKMRAMYHAGARYQYTGLQNVGPDEKQLYQKQAKNKAQNDALDALAGVSGVRGAVAHAKGSKASYVLSDTLHGKKYKGLGEKDKWKEEHNQVLATKHHEDLHQMFKRVHEKYGPAARSNLALRLLGGLSGDHQEKIDDLQNTMTGQDTYDPNRIGKGLAAEEKIARIVNHLNSPTDRVNFHEIKDRQTHKELSNGDVIPYDHDKHGFDTEIKRAYKHLRNMANSADESWLKPIGTHPIDTMKKSEDGSGWDSPKKSSKERLLELKSKKVTNHQLLQALNDSNPDVRAFAAAHPNLSFEGLFQALSHKDLRTRWAATTNPNFTAEHQTIIDIDPELKEVLDKNELKKNIGFVEFPRLNQGVHTEPMSMGVEQARQRKELLGDKKKQVSGGKLFYNVNTKEDKRLPARQRIMSGYVLDNGPDSGFKGRRDHEAQHSVFAAIAQKHGTAAHQAAVSHVMSAISPTEKNFLRLLNPQLEKYPQEKREEEYVTYMQNVLQDPERRNSLLNGFAPKGKPLNEEQKMKAHTQLKDMWKRMKAAALTFGPEHVEAAKAAVKKNIELRLEELSKKINDHIETDWTGFSAEASEALSAAEFMAGTTSNQEEYRKKYWESENHVEAALASVGLESTEENVKALEAVIAVKKLSKNKDIEVPSKITPYSNSSKDNELCQRLTKELPNLLVPDFKGKHTEGMFVVDGFLIKPGIGKCNPALGMSQQQASRSQCEAAFYEIAEEVGLGERFAKTVLVLVDGAHAAAIQMIPEAKSLESLRLQSPSLPAAILEKYRVSGELHCWAALDFILGNVDRHGQNVLVGSQENGFPVYLIDHSSCFAGEAFNPGMDKNSFVPFYLRAWNQKTFKNADDLKEKLKLLPLSTEQGRKEIGEFLARINPAKIEAIMALYEIDPSPSMERLGRLQKMAQSGKSMDTAINMLWIGLLNEEN